jgi:two-component system chemotaxis response regulator CheY
MVVDDNPAILQIVATILNVIDNARVFSFESPNSALAAFKDRQGEFNMVLTDLEMPEMNGLELCNALRAERPGIPVLLMTGNHDAIDEPTAKLFGFTALIYKPFTPAELKRQLENVGALRGAASEVPVVSAQRNR